MLEPAAFGASVAFGPNTENFRDIVRLLRDADACEELDDLDAVRTWLGEQLADPISGAARGRRAKNFVLGQQGALQRTVNTVLRLLGEERPMRKVAS